VKGACFYLSSPVLSACPSWNVHTSKGDVFAKEEVLLDALFCLFRMSVAGGQLAIKSTVKRRLPCTLNSCKRVCVHVALIFCHPSFLLICILI